MQLEQVQEMDIDMDILIPLSEAFFGTWQTSIIELFCENSYRLKALKKLSAKKKKQKTKNKNSIGDVCKGPQYASVHH